MLGAAPAAKWGQHPNLAQCARTRPVARTARAGSPSATRLHQPAPNRVPRQLDPVVHPELVEDVRAVAVDGLLADHERVGDLPGAVALGDQLDDLLLARRERVLADRLLVASLTQVVADQVGHRARIDERLAPHRRPASLDQVPVDDGLQHVPRRACLQRLVEIPLVVVHRQDQRAQLRPPPAQLGDRLQPGHPRHRDVDDREIDVRIRAELDRLGAVTGLGHHLEIGLGIEHQAQAAPDDGVVVDQEDAGLEWGHEPVRAGSGRTEQNDRTAAVVV